MLIILGIVAFNVGIFVFAIFDFFSTDLSGLGFLASPKRENSNMDGWG